MQAGITKTDSEEQCSEVSVACLWGASRPNPQNQRNLTVGSVFLPIFSFAFLPSIGTDCTVCSLAYFNEFNSRTFLGKWNVSICTVVRWSQMQTSHQYGNLQSSGWGLFVGWLLNVPATCECISGTDLLRQFYVLPHWDRSCRPNFPSHPVTVYWHQANQSQHWPYIARRLAG